jgi:hypothetical protein
MTVRDPDPDQWGDMGRRREKGGQKQKQKQKQKHDRLLCVVDLVSFFFFWLPILCSVRQGKLGGGECVN